MLARLVGRTFMLSTNLSFVSGGQQVFEFVRMMAHNEVYLRCPQLANGG